MSNIKQLIQQLCPNGVEWKMLGEVTYWDKRFNEVDRSMQPEICKYHYYLANELEDLESPSGTIKILYTSNRVAFAEEEDVKDNVVDAEIVAIPWGGNANIKYFNGKFITADNRIAVVRDKSILSTKYVYYWLTQNQAEIDSFYRGAGIKHPSMLKMLSLPIPIPPLEIQKKIVECLDKFSALAAELQAELQLRKKQYEYYRTRLLSFDTDVTALTDNTDDAIQSIDNQPIRGGYKWLKLSELGELKAGKGIIAAEIHEVKDDCYSYPCYGGNGIRGYVKSYSHDGCYPIIGRQGALCGCVAYASGKFYATEHAVVVTPNKNMNVRFLFHLLTHADLNQYKSQGAQPGLAVKTLNELKFPIPPLKTQERIANLLDKFETLTADLQNGLPAEMKLQQQRYEYYRNQLMTF